MARSTTMELTPRQRQIFEWVKNFIREHAMPPTVREIGDAFRIKSSSAFELLKTLERKSYLRRGDRGARSLIIEGARKRRGLGHGVAEVAIVGRIAAGQPIEAIEHDCGTIAVNKDLLHGHEAYALKVEGQSMVETGILDGDYVIVRKQDTADDGDIVVALIENEATLKRFYQENGRVRLEPANRAMAPIHVTCGEFRVQGKVVGVVRIMSGHGPGRRGAPGKASEVQR
jgi:repressor LexA